MNIKQKTMELIGHTPLLELNNLEKEFNLNARLIAKLEYFNLSGSVKDRVALRMIEEEEEKGYLKAGSTIIEPTSGNTGIGLSAVGVAKGYRVIIVMPETMSVERRNMIRGYGAEVVLSEGSKGMNGAIIKAHELAQEIPSSYIPQQFENHANDQAHYDTTGPEIWQDTDGQVDIFISGIGTGGTISGVGKYLKEKNSKIQIIGVEPENSAVLTGGKSGPHKIQGIGAGFVPKILDTKIYNEIIKVKDEDAFKMGRLMGKKEGVLVGISSGAALQAAIEVAQRKENKDKLIVVILPDSGDRYLSTALFTK